MTRALALLGLLAVALGASVPPVAAQSDGELEVVEADVEDYPTVSFTVTAPRALVGVDLVADDFAVTEAGEPRPATISELSHEDLQVVLLVDTSGSMAGAAMEAARGAADQFVAQMPQSTRIAVVEFNNEPLVVSPFTTDRSSLTTAIQGLEASGFTALYDAVNVAVEAFSSEPEGRQSIVLLSDGGDTASEATLSEATATLAGSDIGLTVVELETDDTDPEALNALADAADGQVVSTDDPGALTALYDEIASKLVNQYQVEYQSTAQGVTEVVLNVERDGIEASSTQVVSLPQDVAATPGPEPRADTPSVHVVAVDTSEYPMVEITVVAPRELAEQELKAEAFKLFETGEPQDFEVRRLGGSDLEVVLALDTSGSMRGAPMEAARAAAKEFIDRLPEAARLALLTFATEPELELELTDDRGALHQAVEEAEVGGHTALYDAAILATDLFTSDTPTGRSVVLLSDGGDTSSTANLQTAAEELARARAGLHVVELVTPETDRPAMQDLVEPSGGLIVSATDPAGLARLLDEVATDVMNQYVLRYETTSRGLVELELGVTSDGVTATTQKAVDLPPPPPVHSFIGSRWGLTLGGATIYLALMLIILMILAPRPARVRLAGSAPATTDPRPGLPAISELAEWATGMADRALRRRDRDRSLNTRLEQAGVNLRPGEFVVLLTSAAVVAGAVGLLLVNGIVGLALVVLTAGAARVGLSMLATRRQAAFSEQLGDTLQLLAGSLRAGYSILQSIDAVSREADTPTREEFRRLVVENRLGRNLHETLDAMARRTGSEDFRWVVQAIEIHREVGGNLADVLDTVATTIRERNQVRRQIKALSAEGRISAYILLALPFVVGFATHLIAPDYLPIMFESPVGIALLITSGVLMVVGAIWMRRIVRLVY